MAWKPAGSNMSDNPASLEKARNSSSTLTFWEVVSDLQSNWFYINVSEKPIRHGENRSFCAIKERGALFIVISAEEVLVESPSILMVHSFIIPLMPRDKAYSGSYMNIA